MYEYLKILVRWRKFIIACGFFAAVITLIVSLLLPKWYTATTSIFPPEPKSTISPYTQILQSLQAPIFGPTAVGARPGTIYIDILKSRKVGEQIVKEFKYLDVYKADLMTHALNILETHTFFSLLENGLLIISFEDRNPQRAAAVTNRYVELLDEFNRELNITRASKKREFISGQLEIHKKELRRAEEALKKFQEVNQAVDLDDQTSAAIDIIADLTGQAVSLEVELELLRYYTSTESNEYKRKKKNYDELLRELRSFKTDSTRASDDVIRSYFPTMNKVPDLSMNYARYFRDVKVEEKVYELLVKEYEQARIEEARDTPTVQVLDSASPPELRSRPKRKRLIFIGSILGLGWGALIALFSTFWTGESNRKNKLKDILNPIITDLKRIFHLARD